jgi:hypothetical protein
MSEQLRSALKAHQPTYMGEGRRIECTCGDVSGGAMFNPETTRSSFVHHQMMAVKKAIKLAEPGVNSTVVLMDIDGVLADNTKHLPLVKEKGWEWFGNSVGEFAPLPIWPQITTVLHRQGFRVILLTNRPERDRERTVRWLQMHGIEYSDMFMWNTSENQAGHKERILTQLLKGHTDIAFAVDDAPEHIEMYTSYGIPAVHVDSGYHNIPGYWDPQEDELRAVSRA